LFLKKLPLSTPILFLGKTDEGGRRQFKSGGFTSVGDSNPS
jgi:hypothetical protein